MDRTALVSRSGTFLLEEEPLPDVAALYSIACPRADLCCLGGLGGVLLKGA